MAHHTIKSGYSNLSDRINRFPQGAPPTELLFSILRMLFSEKEAELVLTDSGTVVEECAIFGTPCITIRESTERIDLIELGVNSLSGMDVDQMLDATDMALSHKIEPVTHYGKNISDKICNILIGNSLNFSKNSSR